MIQLIRGFKDILPGEVEIWQNIEKTARSLFEDFGFKEIRLPILERTELFARSIGEDTDIVEKEMYTFPDRREILLHCGRKLQHLLFVHIFSIKCMQRILYRNFTASGRCFAEKDPRKEGSGNSIRLMPKCLV